MGSRLKDALISSSVVFVSTYLGSCAGSGLQALKWSGADMAFILDHQSARFSFSRQERFYRERIAYCNSEFTRLQGGGSLHDSSLWYLDREEALSVLEHRKQDAKEKLRPYEHSLISFIPGIHAGHLWGGAGGLTAGLILVTSPGRQRRRIQREVDDILLREYSEQYKNEQSSDP